MFCFTIYLIFEKIFQAIKLFCSQCIDYFIFLVLYNLNNSNLSIKLKSSKRFNFIKVFFKEINKNFFDKKTFDIEIV